MTRAVEWSSSALDDLDRQIAYIAADSPGAALRVADRIRDAAGLLGELPTGRPGRVSGTYEKVLAPLPFILAYALTARGGREIVAILRVIHTSRDWPPNGWPT